MKDKQTARPNSRANPSKHPGSINQQNDSVSRWLSKDGTYEAWIIASKNRIASVKVVNVVRLELSGAVIGKRLRVFTQAGIRYNFTAAYHIEHSKIVKAMISKESYGFNTYAAKQIREIQEKTSPQEWFLGGRKLEHCRLGNSKEKPDRTRTTQCMAERPRLFEAASRGVASIKPCQCRRATWVPQSNHEC